MQVLTHKSFKKYPKRDLNPHSHYWPKDFKSFVSTIPPFGHPLRRAENEARTRDPNLGKVVLYQLSYFRIANYRFHFTVPNIFPCQGWIPFPNSLGQGCALPTELFPHLVFKTGAKIRSFHLSAKFCTRFLFIFPTMTSLLLPSLRS